jgi:hypothetical protein
MGEAILGVLLIAVAASIPFAVIGYILYGRQQP